MKRNVWMLLGVLLLTLSLTAGCAAKSVRETVVVEKQAESRGYSGVVEAPAAAPIAAEAVHDQAASGGAANLGLGAASDQMIIRTVNMTMTVKDTDQTLAEIKAILAQAQGYMAASNRYMVGEQPWASVTMRVPAATLDAVLDQVRGLAIRIENENSSAEDVTEEYTDLQARQRNLEATEKELLALLTEVRESGGKADDILAVHNRLTEVRGQIEQLKGRSQYLERMVAMATINLEIRPKEAPISVVQKEKWSPLVTLSKALRAFVQVLQFLVDVLLNVLVFSPFVLVPAVVIWLIVRAVRRRQAKKK